MGFSTDSLRVETVTPDKAREFLSYNYAHQRKLRPAWVKYLTNEMQEGRFMPTAEIHVMYRNGEPVLINGQHTCNAIVAYGKPVRATVRKTSTGEVGQIAMMYSLGHDNGMKRTFSDGLGAYAVADTIELGPEYTQRLATAIRHIRAGFTSDSRIKTVSPATLAEMVNALPVYAPAAKFFWNNVTAPAGDFSRIRSSISKRGTLSVLVVTYRYRQQDAHKFWEAMVNPGLSDNNPIWYARRAIEDSMNQRGKGYSVKPEMLSRMLAKCWNNYLSGTPMKQAVRKSDIDEVAPIVISGTPYNGRQPAPPWWPPDVRDEMYQLPAQ